MSGSVKLGDDVFVVMDPRQNNGADVAPAKVTRVWSDEMVNVKVLGDGPDNLWITSIKLVNSRPDEDDESISKDAAGIQRVAFRKLD